MIGTTFDVEVIAAGNGEAATFADGDVIHRRGEAADHAFIVKRGSVEIRQKGRAVETIAVGEIFGELALLDDEPRGASAVAVGDVELIAIDQRMFTTLLRDDPEFALTVLRLLARRLRATTAMFEHCVDELPALAKAS
jgi:CRP/FNR family cyclic AMP-dependent transcriptional regulator